MTRLLERNAHYVLWLIGGLLFLVFLLATGWLQILPDDGTPQGIRLASYLLKWVAEHQVGIDMLLRSIGVATTLLGGVTTIYFGILHFRRTLPSRFFELMKADSRALIANRDRARLHLIDSSRLDFQTNRVTLFMGPLTRALQSLRLGHPDMALQQLNDVSSEAKTHRALAIERLNSLTQQEATAHLLRGVIFASKARAGTSEQAQHEEMKRAETAYSETLSLVPADVDALELRAELRWGQNRFDEAEEDFEALRIAAQNGCDQVGQEMRMLLIQARACRRLAMLTIDKAVRRRARTILGDARDYLEEGSMLLASNRHLLGVEHTIEIGHLKLIAAELFKMTRQPILFANAKRDGCLALEKIRHSDAEGILKTLLDLSYDEQED